MTKMTKMTTTSWLLSLLLFRKSSGKTVNNLHQKGFGYVPGGFQTEKVWIIVPGQVSVQERHVYDLSTQPPESKNPNGGKGDNTIC